MVEVVDEDKEEEIALDKIIEEEETKTEEEEEEEETKTEEINIVHQYEYEYECPECGNPINEMIIVCPKCGIELEFE